MNTLSQRIQQHQHLRAIRNQLIHLHQVLLTSERITYEQQGRVSSGELLQLVIDHDQFAWLHHLSQQIVQIDERLQADMPTTLADVENLGKDIRSLLTPAIAGSKFAKKYYAALQQDPDVVLAHAQVLALLAH